MSLVQLDVPFAALAARGRQVTWLRIHQPEHDLTAELVLDTTGGIVYCEEKWLGLFAHATAATDPLALAMQRGWELRERVDGQLACAIVATSRAPREASIRSTLFVDTSTPPGPYR